MMTRLVRLTKGSTGVLLTMALAAPTSVHAEDLHMKLDTRLRAAVRSGCSGAKSVIVRTKPGERDAVRRALKARGGAVSGEFPALDALVVGVDCEDLLDLAGLGASESISSNSRVRAHRAETIATVSDDTVTSLDASRQSSTTSASTFSSRLNEALAAQQLQANLMATLGVQQSWFTALQSYLLPQVGVAVIDSGLEAGIDFGGRITAFYDFTGGDIRAKGPSDPYGHGTHVAGLIGSTFVGVAPTVRLIGLKVLDGQGRGTTANVIRAIEFATLNKDVLKISVLNLSLGHPIYESAATDPLVQAVEHAVREGLTVVVSAGNFGRNKVTGVVGYAGIASPSNAPSAISVGAVRTFDSVTRDDDRIAGYSSRGPSWIDGFAKPDLSAPGDNLLSVAALGSALRVVQEQRGNVGNYMRLSGTSMAAGVTAGMAARVLQTNSRLTPNALKMVLQYSSIPVRADVGYADALTQGAGSIGSGALTLARAIDATAPLGSKWLVASVTPKSTLGAQTYVWAQRMVWGNHIARGAGVIDEQRPAWALDVVWGDGLEDDDNIVWGNLHDDDNVVWGNALDQDDNIVWGYNLVWGNSLDSDDNIVWGNLDDDNIVWGNFDDDNIVWGNNIVWGDALLGMRLDDDNIVWGNFDDDNIVWGYLDDDNIVWGNAVMVGTVLVDGTSARGRARLRTSLKRGGR